MDARGEWDVHAEVMDPEIINAFSQAGLDQRSLEIRAREGKAIRPKSDAPEAELRPVGERIDDDEEEVMVADLRGDGRRRRAGLFPAARGVGSGLSHDRKAVDADDLFGTGFYSDAEIDGDIDDEAVIEKRESDDVEEEEVEVLEEYKYDITPPGALSRGQSKPLSHRSGHAHRITYQHYITKENAYE